jgi:hypothetical protein
MRRDHGHRVADLSFKPESRARCNVFVAGLPVDTLETALHDALKKFGPIDKLDLRIPYGDRNAIAHVRFKRADDAARLIACGVRFREQRLQLEYADIQD